MLVDWKFLPRLWRLRLQPSELSEVGFHYHLVASEGAAPLSLLTPDKVKVRRKETVRPYRGYSSNKVCASTGSGVLSSATRRKASLTIPLGE